MKKIAFLLAILLLLGSTAGCKEKEDEALSAEPTESIPYEGEFDHMHAPGEHVFVSEEIVVADCVNDGTILHICVICGEGVEETVAAYGHELDIPTCTDPGRCVQCGAITEKAMGHTTKKGVCDRCGETVG